MTGYTVHATTIDGALIVRFDRAGKWFLLWGRDQRRQLTLAEAARLANEEGADVNFGMPGGSAFDRAVRAQAS